MHIGRNYDAANEWIDGLAIIIHTPNQYWSTFIFFVENQWSINTTIVTTLPFLRIPYYVTPN